MQVALNNMSQGLCMFDRNERLVLCNQRYIEIYRLSAEIAKPGTTIADMLDYRAANGTFMRDPNGVPAANWSTPWRGAKPPPTKSNRPTAGSSPSINRAMPGGGWVGSHDDITEQRDAELERASMQEQQQRRAMIEQAIAAFRQRVEEHLHTATEGAMAMRSTAATLSANSGRTSTKRRRRRIGIERSLGQCRDRRHRRPTNWRLRSARSAVSST